MQFQLLQQHCQYINIHHDGSTYTQTCFTGYRIYKLIKSCFTTTSYQSYAFQSHLTKQLNISHTSSLVLLVCKPFRQTGISLTKIFAKRRRRRKNRKESKKEKRRRKSDMCTLLCCRQDPPSSPYPQPP